MESRLAWVDRIRRSGGNTMESIPFPSLPMVSSARPLIDVDVLRRQHRIWWKTSDSNRSPPPCKGSALPNELVSRGWHDRIRTCTFRLTAGRSAIELHANKTGGSEWTRTTSASGFNRPLYLLSYRSKLVERERVELSGPEVTGLQPAYSANKCLSNTWC